jgi:general secretion pathway protein J
MTHSASRRGFTLIEVMVALSIMALIMVGLYTTLNTTLNTRDLLEREVKAARLGPQILDLIESDLRRVWTFNIDDDMVFKGERRTLLGESADTLLFLSSVDSTLVHRVGERDVISDVCETGYRLRPNPLLPDVLELWRRQSFHVDEDPLEDGSYERVHDRVVSLQFRYFEDNDIETDAEDDWDASVTHSLPSMVQVTLGIEVGPRSGDNREQREIGTYWYERLIPLTRDAGLTMRVHSLPPTFVTGPGQAAGGATGDENTPTDGDRDGDGVPDEDDPAPDDVNVPFPGGKGNPENPFGSGGDDRDDDDGGGGGNPDNPFDGGGGGGDPNDIFDDIFG